MPIKLSTGLLKAKCISLCGNKADGAGLSNFLYIIDRWELIGKMVAIDLFDETLTTVYCSNAMSENCFNNFLGKPLSMK